MTARLPVGQQIEAIEAQHHTEHAAGLGQSVSQCQSVNTKQVTSYPPMQPLPLPPHTRQQAVQSPRAAAEEQLASVPRLSTQPAINWESPAQV
jgi:hypothetical protein